MALGILLIALGLTRDTGATDEAASPAASQILLERVPTGARTPSITVTTTAESCDARPNVRVVGRWRATSTSRRPRLVRVQAAALTDASMVRGATNLVTSGPDIEFRVQERAGETSTVVLAAKGPVPTERTSSSCYLALPSLVGRRLRTAAIRGANRLQPRDETQDLRPAPDRTGAATDTWVCGSGSTRADRRRADFDCAARAVLSDGGDAGRLGTILALLGGLAGGLGFILTLRRRHKDEPPAARETAKGKKPKTPPRTLEELWAFPLLSLVVVAFYASARESLLVLGIGIALSAAAFSAGAALGFLFAVPKTVTGKTELAADEPWRYQPNDNLMQVSDWLTKILVGVGLVEFGEIEDGISRLLNEVAPAMGDTASSRPFALAILVFGTVGGFLCSYLVTRIVVGPRLWAADQEVLDHVREVAARTVEAVLDQDEAIAAEAHGLVGRQLAGDDPPDPSELRQAIVAASQSVRVTIFNEAEKARKAAVLRRPPRRPDDPATREELEERRKALARTIPIYEALVEADEEQRYHRNPAALGYALMAKPQPDWQRAIAQFDRAIEIRDRRGVRGYRIYELNRAVCRIQVEPDKQDAIATDLRATAGNDIAQKALERDYWGDGVTTVEDWCKAHGLEKSAFLVRSEER